MSSLYFTPPLSISDKWLLYECLGLSDLQYYYYEVKENLLIQSLHCHGKEVVPELRFADANSVTTFIQDTSINYIIVRHPGDLLRVVARPFEQSIYEQLFPFPFCFLLSHINDASLFKVKVFSGELLNKIHILLMSLRRLENFMSEQEVTFAWIESSNGYYCFSLLFHYVQGRCIRVGSSPKLADFGQRFSQGELGVDDLRGVFGTKVKTIKIKINMSISLDPLLRLAHSIEDALAAGAHNPNSVTFQEKATELELML